MKHIKQLCQVIIASALSVGAANADQVILDDLIVDGSACIGLDCVNGESFGFDTLRLKENNLRIRAFDTSTSASFPSNDWQITFNETSNGGANKFSIDDIDGGRTPFTIEAGTPSHSLYVDDGGRIGLGTSTPVVEIHVKDGDTPTLRLEQDGSSGFTPQTWDMAGNEAGFFIRDATNGSTLPFRIRPSAPSSSIDVAADGDVGVGTGSPGTLTLAGANASLHVRRTDGEASILVEEASGTTASREMLNLKNNGGPFLTLSNTSTGDTWLFNHENSAPNRFIISSTVTAGAQFALSNTGDLEIGGGLITTGGGGACTLADPCDRVFDKTVYEIPSIEEHAEQMWSQMHLPAVGPTKPDQPINMTVKMLRMLNELEKAHVYIDQLNTKVVQLTKEKDEALSAFEERLSKLESQ